MTKTTTTMKLAGLFIIALMVSTETASRPVTIEGRATQVAAAIQ